MSSYSRTSQAQWDDSGYTANFAQQFERRVQERNQRRLYREAELRKARDEVKQRVTTMCACLLEQMFLTRDDKLPADPSQISIFHADKPPSMSVSQYFHRIVTYSQCSVECLVMGLMHVNNLLHNQTHFEITSLTIHRLILASIMSTAKFFDDQYFNNAFYARIGGVPLKELNALEVAFLGLIGFDLAVPATAYEYFLSQISSPSAHTDCVCDCSLPFTFLLSPAAMLKIEGLGGSYSAAKAPSASQSLLPVPSSPATLKPASSLDSSAAPWVPEGQKSNSLAASMSALSLAGPTEKPEEDELDLLSSLHLNEDHVQPIVLMKEAARKPPNVVFCPPIAQQNLLARQNPALLEHEWSFIPVGTPLLPVPFPAPSPSDAVDEPKDKKDDSEEEEEEDEDEDEEEDHASAKDMEAYTRSSSSRTAASSSAAVHHRGSYNYSSAPPPVVFGPCSSLNYVQVGSQSTQGASAHTNAYAAARAVQYPHSVQYPSAAAYGQPSQQYSQQYAQAAQAAQAAQYAQYAQQQQQQQQRMHHMSGQYPAQPAGGQFPSYMVQTQTLSGQVVCVPVVF